MTGSPLSDMCRGRLDVGHLLTVRVFLPDIDDWPKFNQLYTEVRV